MKSVSTPNVHFNLLQNKFSFENFQLLGEGNGRFVHLGAICLDMLPHQHTCLSPPSHQSFQSASLQLPYLVFHKGTLIDSCRRAGLSFQSLFVVRYHLFLCFLYLLSDSKRLFLILTKSLSQTITKAFQNVEVKTDAYVLGSNTKNNMRPDPLDLCAALLQT